MFGAKEIKRRLGLAIPRLIAAVVLVYFGYHALNGARGYRALVQLEDQVAQADAELALLNEERQRLDARVDGLREESLDPDLLEEQARRVLNYGYPGETTILRAPDDN